MAESSSVWAAFACVDESIDVTAETEARDVRKVANSLSAIARAVGHAAGIDDSGLALGQPLDGSIDFVRHAECAGEVTSGSKRQNSDFCVTTQVGGQQSGHDLAKRAVPARDDDSLNSRPDALPGDALRISRTARELDLELSEGVSEFFFDHFPTAPGRSVAAARIRDYKSAHRCGAAVGTAAQLCPRSRLSAEPALNQAIWYSFIV